MATPLDVGVNFFSGLFPLLFTFLVVYGVLSYTKVLGDNKAVPAFIAVLLAIATYFSTVAVKTINMMAPWFVLLFVFGIFVLIAYQLFGVKEESLTTLWTKNWSEGGGTLFYWILAFVLMIGLGSLFTVLKQEKLPPIVIENATAVAGSAGPGFWATMTNPKVLGAALLLLIAMFAIKHLTSASSK